MQFIYDDGGRSAAGFKGNAGDCVCRAIAIATQQPYRKVFDDLSGFGWFPGNRMKRDPDGLFRSRPDNEKALTREYLATLGWKWTPTTHIGSGCKVHLADGELPMGRLIVRVSKHLTTVIDGVIRDTFNPEREKSYIFEPDHGQELKPNQGRNQNGVWTEIGGRCVYGYWSVA
jgi:hypothetical protein